MSFEYSGAFWRSVSLMMVYYDSEVTLIFLFELFVIF